MASNKLIPPADTSGSPIDVLDIRAYGKLDLLDPRVNGATTQYRLYFTFISGNPDMYWTFPTDAKRTLGIASIVAEIGFQVVD